MSFLDLPEPNKWNQSFNVTDKFTLEAAQKIKELSQAMSVQEEVLETVNQENNGVDQNMSIPTASNILPLPLASNS